MGEVYRTVHTAHVGVPNGTVDITAGDMHGDSMRDARLGGCGLLRGNGLVVAWVVQGMMVQARLRRTR